VSGKLTDMKAERKCDIDDDGGKNKKKTYKCVIDTRTVSYPDMMMVSFICRTKKERKRKVN